MDSNPQTSSEQIEKVCIVGSGNWGSAIATLVGRNCRILANCDNEVNMWVYEEMVETEDGSIQKLTDVINTQHENIKYLPGIRLPENVKAVPDLEEACQDATLLIFVLPHQFLPRLLPTIREAASPSCRGVSLIKGLGKEELSSTRIVILDVWQDVEVLALLAVAYLLKCTVRLTDVFLVARSFIKVFLSLSFSRTLTFF